MRAISSLDELNIPDDHKNFLSHFLSKLSSSRLAGEIYKVILFGSCAREDVRERSDVDIFVITHKELPLDEELYILGDCHPAVDGKFYAPADIIVNSMDSFNRFNDSFGMVQKAVKLEGVDLSGLL